MMMEDPKNSTELTDAAKAELQADEVKKDTPKPLSKKVEKAKKKQERAFQTMITTYQAQNRRAVKRERDQLNLLKRQLGKEDFNALKSVCTVEVPEQKDETGAVIQEKKTVVNKRALLVEASHLLVLLREERIKKGTRKRTTGRHSDRVAHRSMMDFLTRRNKEAAKELVK